MHLLILLPVAVALRDHDHEGLPKIRLLASGDEFSDNCIDPSWIFDIIVANIPPNVRILGLI